MRWSLIVMVLASCRSSAPAPSPAPSPAAPVATPKPLDRDYPRLATRATQMYRDVANMFTAAGDNCAAATQKLGELQRTYADVVDANSIVLREGRARQLRAALDDHASELEASMKTIVASKTMATCTEDRAFTAAFDFLGAPP